MIMQFVSWGATDVGQKNWAALSLLDLKGGDKDSLGGNDCVAWLLLS